MSRPQPDPKDPSYKVKNTFLEFPIPTDDHDPGSQTRRRCKSDGTDLRHSPLVLASKSPIHSPSLRPVDETMQAVPIDEVDFQLLEEACDPAVPSRSRYNSDGGEAAVAQATPGLGRDEPAYVVPTTPSPFLHSACPPTVVPPFGGYGNYGIPDMGLPPAFDEGEPSQANGGEGAYEFQVTGEGGYDMQDAEGNYMQGMPIVEWMYDPSYGQYMPYGWAPVPMDGSAEGGVDGGTAVAAADAQDSMVGSPPSAGPSEAPLPVPPVPEVAKPSGAAEAVTAAETRPAEARASEARQVEAWDSQDRPERPREREGRRGKGRGRDGREEERTERRAPITAGGASGGAAAKTEASRGAAARMEASSAAAEGKDAGQDVPGAYTTVMLRNIPNKYTREMLIKQLSIDYDGEFDFMYLPIDFKNKCNVGYGFINFRTTEACSRFVKAFHGVDVRKCLPGLNSNKVVEVTPARVQGLSENVRRLRNSPVMNQLVDHPEWMPLLFNSAGKEEPFPCPDQPLPPVKPRGRNRDGANRDAGW